MPSRHYLQNLYIKDNFWRWKQMRPRQAINLKVNISIVSSMGPIALVALLPFFSALSFHLPCLLTIVWLYFIIRLFYRAPTSRPLFVRFVCSMVGSTICFRNYLMFSRLHAHVFWGVVCLLLILEAQRSFLCLKSMSCNWVFVKSVLDLSPPKFACTFVWW